MQYRTRKTVSKKFSTVHILGSLFFAVLVFLPLITQAARVVTVEEVVNQMLRTVTSLQEQAIQNNDFRFNDTIQSITSQIRSLRGVQGTVTLDTVALSPTRTFAYGTPCMYNNTIYPDGAIRSIGQFARQEIVCRHGFWVADRVNLQLPVPNLRVAGGTDGEAIVRFTAPSLCYRMSVDFGDGTIQRNQIPQNTSDCLQSHQTVEFAHQYQSNATQRITINIEDKWVSSHTLQRGIVTLDSTTTENTTNTSGGSGQLITSNNQQNQSSSNQCSGRQITDMLVIDDITMRLTGAEYICENSEYVVSIRNTTSISNTCEGILDPEREYPNSSRLRLSHESGTINATCRSGNWDITANLTF